MKKVSGVSSGLFFFFFFFKKRYLNLLLSLLRSVSRNLSKSRQLKPPPK